jgi:uncharacterized protein YecE (DUF72 family)
MRRMKCEKFFLGCPVWAHVPWRGTFFTREARREEFLQQYAEVFNTAEGNATFYGLPAVETVARWREEAPGSFRFCLKFPRAITHDHALEGPGAMEETQRFLERVAPLGARLGPFFLQLHASFGAGKMKVLETYLKGLPQEFAYAVEVRSADFFDGGAKERALDALLGERGMDRVIFDTRGLFASRATDEATLDAQRRKPRGPLRLTATGKRPFVRFVGDPEVAKNDAALKEWAAVVARWIEEGRTPFFFTHHPDDAHAPELGRRFQGMLRERSAFVPPPAVWPVEREPKAAEQMSFL